MTRRSDSISVRHLLSECWRRSKVDLRARAQVPKHTDRASVLIFSGETRMPSVKVSANMNDHARTNNPVRMAIDDENKDFMALMGS